MAIGLCKCAREGYRGLLRGSRIQSTARNCCAALGSRLGRDRAFRESPPFLQRSLDMIKNLWCFLLIKEDGVLLIIQKRRNLVRLVRINICVIGCYKWWTNLGNSFPREIVLCSRLLCDLSLFRCSTWCKLRWAHYARSHLESNDGQTRKLWGLTISKSSRRWVNYTDVEQWDKLPSITSARSWSDQISFPLRLLRCFRRSGDFSASRTSNNESLSSRCCVESWLKDMGQKVSQ